MSEPITLHLALPVAPARDAVAAALAEQGFTVQPSATGSLDVSRGSLGTTLVAGAFAGKDMHVRFDVHVTETSDGAAAQFVHSAAGGFFKGGAVGAVRAGDTVREAAHLAGVRLAEQGLLVGAVPVPPAPETPSETPAPLDASALPSPEAGFAPPAAPATSPSHAEAATPPPSAGPGAPLSDGGPAAPPPYVGASGSPDVSAPAMAASVPPPVDYANRTNIVAIFAIILGFLVPLGGVIAGAVGLAQIKRTGERGRGLALTGIIAGSVLTVVTAIAVISFFVFVFVGATQSGGESGGGFVDPGGQAPTEVMALQVGQCLDDVSTGIVTEDNLVDCAVPHTYEVFGDIAIPGDTLPSDDEIQSTAFEACDEIFAAYVGVAYEESTLDYTYVGPTADSWAGGDRQIACLVTDPAGLTTGSLRGSAG
ncbi:MAG: hypothetical protein K0S37_2531 [Microbacterium sp.]|jgi:hypothetical protein|nr:hypothetical protein [Microbacterium sp.]